MPVFLLTNIAQQATKNVSYTIRFSNHDAAPAAIAQAERRRIQPRSLQWAKGLGAAATGLINPQRDPLRALAIQSENASDQRPATADEQYQQTASRVRCIAWFSNMADGKGCKCAAYDQSECCCDADWTPQEVYDLRAEIERLRLTDEERDAIWTAAEAYAENDGDPECERLARVMQGLWHRTK